MKQIKLDKAKFTGQSCLGESKELLQEFKYEQYMISKCVTKCVKKGSTKSMQTLTVTIQQLKQIMYTKILGIFKNGLTSNYDER